LYNRESCFGANATFEKIICWKIKILKVNAGVQFKRFITKVVHELYLWTNGYTAPSCQALSSIRKQATSWIHKYWIEKQGLDTEEIVETNDLTIGKEVYKVICLLLQPNSRQFYKLNCVETW